MDGTVKFKRRIMVSRFLEFTLFLNSNHTSINIVDYVVFLRITYIDK